MILIYGECDRQPREAARTYARRYPQREQLHYKFFMRLESSLRKNGQCDLSLQVHIYLEKFLIIFNLKFFYHYFHTSYSARRINIV